ncbi:DNA/RNA-binding protein KIN17-like isoform X2 [Halichondria panicea]|uniref:DNA/RNA-binding protein KIN17-like isoform X2 n=1 Tax=Halichondria panicea TaxID=6063 RepID=UPI00312B7475
MSKKPGFLTPKAISNRIKSKGLQKLRWFCQMCQKQCRDENGFKCHMMSEAHQRQMLLVAENPGMYIGGFSDQFLKDFMWLLSRSYGTRRVSANEVYQVYIKDKNHSHMNATRWETLTGFVCWLGKTGLCEVEHTEKGWFIKYIDRSPEAMEREAASAKKDKMEKDDDERARKVIDQQIARALATKGEEDEGPTYTELQRTSEEEKVVFSLKPGGASAATVDPTDPTNSRGSSPQDEPSPTSTPSNQLPGNSEGFIKSKPPPLTVVQSLPNALKSSKPSTTSGRESVSSHKSSKNAGQKRKLTALDEIRLREEEHKEKRNRRDNWITEGIVVKVVHSKLGERFYKKKGVVSGVKEEFSAVVEMLETGDKIRIDQAHLETVIPAIGKSVQVVNGAYRGHRAILEALDTKNFCVTIQIDQGPARGRIVERVPYEDISKLHS